MNSLIDLAVKNLSDILQDAIKIQSTERALVLYDKVAPLAQILTDGYRRALPEAEFLDIDSVTPEEAIEKMRSMKSGDLVVLVQSMNFRLNEFRIRIELFSRNLKTIEHIHLARMSEDQFETYIHSLAYDKEYYRPLGHALKRKMDLAKQVVVECFGGTKLVYEAPMEDAKMNIGDYTEMKNVGGTFPIGEVFTETTDFKKVNGEVMIFGYADANHRVKIVEPFVAQIKESILTAPNAPEDFQEILKMIQESEEVTVREFGLSLNPSMSKNVVVNDITAYERQLGLHISLGAKHAIYPKPGFHRKKGRYHVDVFIDIERISVDEEAIFSEGKFCVEKDST
jgi:leucyl aminopeptidase (aminopeptidase T)